MSVPFNLFTDILKILESKNIINATELSRIMGTMPNSKMVTAETFTEIEKIIQENKNARL